MELADWRRYVDERMARYRAARVRLDRERQAQADADAQVAACLEAQQLAQRVAQDVQQQAHERIAGVVTRSLAAVFGDEAYTFRIRFEQKRGRTEAVLEFVRGGLVVDPLAGSGGGAVDVAAFALRLSSMMLSRPPVRRLLVLDEPFRFVSEEYRGRVRALVEALAADLGVQVVMVTHCRELETGNVIRLE